jgi:hypothetical protein
MFCRNRTTRSYRIYKFKTVCDFLSFSMKQVRVGCVSLTVWDYVCYLFLLENQNLGDLGNHDILFYLKKKIKKKL